MQDNKLIAEFMGDSTRLHGLQLQYHTSWDWLMPVVESCFERLDARDASADEIKRQLLVCNLKGIHTAVIEFIKTYN